MSTDEPATPWQPQIGETVRDTVGKRVGRVVDRTYGRYWLRPLGGGIEWDVPAADLLPVTAADLLSTAVAEANERSSNGAAT
ncbi:hypothetical protein [Streptomyces qinzhouensis]|uniref:Uncharacterized protein n=1 Tax=Streptomyces qinzhouensis TaxID=2599401 RepID=A0A5B8IFM0_9ACTN|nr:hypothetical protein [Streptomyces qinzhouensis]QDY77378.1 hypothetical protein FQU76_13555 [Streptomyces qinzhouensis]